MNHLTRRNFIKNSGLTIASATLFPIFTSTNSNPTLLIISGWQDVNIGDIAHTPGLIALIKKRLPKAKLILWKRSKSDMVEQMLSHHFQDLKVIHGGINKQKEPLTEEVKNAFKEADFFIHGSGPYVVAADYLDAWYHHTKKPFGIFGVTIQTISPALKQTLQNASFIFTRETASILKLEEVGLQGKFVAFAPDATFAMDIYDEPKAQQFMEKYKLKERKFLCVIPRLRKTPYYKIHANQAGWSREKIEEVDTLNDKWKELDHAKLREAITVWVRKTKNKVVVCPEMTYQVDIMDELLIDPLPEDVKPYMVKHDYWLPDEAASLYAKAFAVLSFECHSPIIAATNGTPCFYLRQPEDTIKGQMYYDLGLADWTFEIEQSSASQITDQLMEITDNYSHALEQVQQAMAVVTKRYDATFKLMQSKFQN